MAVGGVSDLDVCDDDDHAVDVGARDPEVARLPVVVVDRGTPLQRVETNDLKHQGLADTVKDPTPKTPSTET